MMLSKLFTYFFYMDLPLAFFWICLGFVLSCLAGLWAHRLCPRAFHRLCWLTLLVTLYIMLGYTLFWRSPRQQLPVLPPFSFLAEGQDSSELYRSMLMNVFFFMPLGITLAFSLPDKLKHRVPCCILVGAALSIFIEAMQYTFALGRCETDDVIMNTLGTAIGALALPLAQQLNHLLDRLRTPQHP